MKRSDLDALCRERPIELALDPGPTAVREVRSPCCPHCRGKLDGAARAPGERDDHIETPEIRPRPGLKPPAHPRRRDRPQDW